MISTNRPNGRPIGPLDLRSDRGRPTLMWLVGPCRTAHIKGKVGIKAWTMRFNGAAVPTDRVNLNRSKAVLPATGCPTTPPSPLHRPCRVTPGHWTSTASPLQRRGTGVYAGAATTPVAMYQKGDPYEGTPTAFPHLVEALPRSMV